MKFLIFFGLISVLNGTISPKKKKKSNDDDDSGMLEGNIPTPQKPKKPVSVLFDRTFVKKIWAHI